MMWRRAEDEIGTPAPPLYRNREQCSKEKDFTKSESLALRWAAVPLTNEEDGDGRQAE